MASVNRMEHNIRILGIDPGTAITGWAILEENKGVIKAIDYGCITTSKKCCDEDRLMEIAHDLSEIIKKYKPTEAAVESLFFFKNQKTVITVAQARGVILLTLTQKSVKVGSYTPLQVKQALTGYGKAEKAQMQYMTKEILGLKALPKPDDVADAIAIAVCHIHCRKMGDIK